MEHMTFKGRLTGIAGWMAFFWTVLMVGGLAAWAYTTTQRNQTQSVEGPLKAVALSAASLIEGDEHQRLVAAGSEDDPEYRRLVDVLKRIQKANSRPGSEIDYIYTFWIDPEDMSKVMFGLDTGEGSGHSPLNSVYEDPPTEAFLKALTSGEPQCDPITKDSYGIAKTAYAPVLDSEGQVVAAVGVDLEAKLPPLIPPLVIFLGLAVIAIATFLSVFVAGMMSPAITRPLEQLSTVAGNVANGDLRTDMKGFNTYREFSGLVNGFQHMLVSLRQLVGRINEGAERLNLWSEELKDQAANAGQGAGEVARMMGEAAAGADSVAASASKVALELARIDQLAGGAMDRAVAAHEAAMGASARADRGVEVVNKVAGAAQQAAQTLSSTASEVEDFTQWSAEIASAAGFITGLAEQIHMLSMNAQIEAARAGEYGRGFGVVAQKITSLSDETSLFADRIGKLNQEMSSKLQHVSSSIQATDRHMSEDADLLGEARTSFMDIAVSVRRVLDTLNEIVGTIEDLKAGTHIGHSETDAIATITMQTAAGIEQISAGSQEQAALVEQVEAAVAHMHDLADSLAEEVRRFRI